MGGAVRGGPLLRVVHLRRGGCAHLRGHGGGYWPPEAGRRVPGQRRGRRVPHDAGARGKRRSLAAGWLARESHRGGAVVPEPLIPRGDPRSVRLCPAIMYLL